MCDSGFDYTLRIEYERISNIDLRSIVKILQYCSSDCYVDLELLADEVIYRMNECEYSLRDKVNSELVKLIYDIYENLNVLSKYMLDIQNERVVKKLLFIRTNFHKFMNSDPSPAASPVVSPKVGTPILEREASNVKVPKIMKKAKSKSR